MLTANSSGFPRTNKQQVLLAIILLFLTHLFWAGNIFASKIAADHIPPILLNSLRWGIAALVLLPFVIRAFFNEWPVIRKQLPQLYFFAFLGITLYNALLYSSAHTSSGINIAVISTLTPLCTFLFAWALYKEKPNAPQLLGFTLGIIGVLLLIFESKLENLLNLEFKLGDLWMLLAVFAWALYTVTFPKNKPKVSSLVFLFATIFVGTLMSLPAVAVEYSQGARWAFQTNDIWLLAYIGIFPSLLSYLFYNYGLDVIGAIKTSLFSYLLPLFTVFIGVFWLNEMLKLYHIIGQILVLLGFYFSVIKG